MTRVIKLVFLETENNKKFTLSLADPKSTLTKSTVVTAMMALTEAQFFIVGNNYETLEPQDAYFYDTEKVELA